jgi:hypothetical protein
VSRLDRTATIRDFGRPLLTVVQIIVCTIPAACDGTRRYYPSIAA